jgi:hypothetical protein
MLFSSKKALPLNLKTFWIWFDKFSMVVSNPGVQCHIDKYICILHYFLWKYIYIYIL